MESSRWSNELGETYIEAGKREVREECSIEIEIERLFDITDYIIRDTDGLISYHFIIIYVIARYVSGKIKSNAESEDIGWFSYSQAAQLDMHPTLKSVLQSLADYSMNR